MITYIICMFVCESRDNGNPPQRLEEAGAAGRTITNRVFCPWQEAHRRKTLASNEQCTHLALENCPAQPPQSGINKVATSRTAISSAPGTDGDGSSSNNQAPQTARPGSTFLQINGLKKRNRLSASDKKAKREAVAADYKAGHPQLAIILRNALSKSQVIEMLAELLQDGTLTPVAPSYEVLPASKAIKSISGLGTSEDGYVRVMKTDQGILLIPYNPKEAENEF